MAEDSRPDAEKNVGRNILGDALRELNEVLGGGAGKAAQNFQDRDFNSAAELAKSNELETPQFVVKEQQSKTPEMEQDRKVSMSVKKGANQKGKRNALGRGLSALMTSNTLEVPVSQPEVTVASSGSGSSAESSRETNQEANFERASRAAILGAKKDSLPRVLQVSKDMNDARGPEPLKIVTPPAPKSLVPKNLALATDASAASSSASGKTQEEVQPVEGLVEIELSQLIANPDQPRQHFSESEIEELSQSLLHSGLLQPILIRKQKTSNSTQQASYEIIAGERRVRAARKAGLTRVPALLRELDDREVLEVSIVENVQRSQLNAVEEARAYSRLQAEFGLSQEEVAKTVGKDRATISNSLRLLKLSEKVQDMLVAEQLSAGHARALLMLDNHASQNAAAKKIVEQLLSVRATEQLVRDAKARSAKGSVSNNSDKKDSSAKGSAIQRQALEERFRRALGTKVALRLNSKGAGELKISFFSQDELEKLLDVVGA